MSLNRFNQYMIPLGLFVKLYDNPIKHTCVHSECISDTDSALTRVSKNKTKRLRKTNYSRH